MSTLWIKTIAKQLLEKLDPIGIVVPEQDPTPVVRLKRREGRRPAILLGLRDNENDSGVIKVWSRKLQVSPSSLTIPVSGSITTEQVSQLYRVE